MILENSFIAPRAHHTRDQTKCFFVQRLKEKIYELLRFNEHNLQNYIKKVTFCNHGVGMKQNTSANIVLCSLSIILLFGSIASSYESLQSSVSLSSNGSINTWPTIEVFINASQVIGINNLSLGLQLDWKWKAWLDSPTLRELTRNASFRLIRFFDFRPNIPRLMPCIYWNEANKTGMWNWTNVDNLVQAIFAVGAEPLVCLGNGNNKTQDYIPSGMVIDPITQLPYPNSYARYCAEWVKHFKAKGWSVRFYEIFNEPWGYFGYRPDLKKLEYFKILWNTCAKTMRSENPAVLLSFSCITSQPVLRYWLDNNGENIDFIDFHKYDCWATSGTGCFDDAELLVRAEREGFETTWTYGVDDAKKMWFNARGVILPIVCSESNLNSAYENGTDPRIQKTIGAIWTALVLRKAILKGLSYYTYYKFCGSGSKVTQSGGIGFGMIDFDSNKPWYPYYVQQIIGNNLKVGDEIVESNCSSDDLRVLAWVHNGSPRVLIISKIDRPRTIHIHGFEDQWQVVKIDNTIPWQNASLQTRVFSAKESLIFGGYTMAFLETIGTA